MARSSLSDIFAEEPVDLTTFVQDKKFLYNPPLSPVQYDVVRHLEQIYYEDLYARMVAEFGDYWNPVRYINFAYVQWGKGCLHIGEKVYDANTGLWREVQTIESDFAVASMDGVSTARAQSSPFAKKGKGPAFEVVTANGRHVRVFEGHQFLVSTDGNQGRASEWRQLRCIRSGDFIATSITLPEPTAPERLDSREVEMIGLWLGDGCMPQTYRNNKAGEPSWGSFCFMTASHEAAARERYRDIVISYPGVIYRETWFPHPRNCVKAWAGTGPRVRANPILDIIRKHGMLGVRYDTKKVPEAIFRLPNDQLRLFISRLWGTDGHIYTPRGKVPEIAYTTVSHQLAVDVQNLLLRLSIRSEIQTKSVKYVKDGVEQPRRVAYVVRIRDYEMCERFAKQITLLDKQHKLDDVLSICAAHQKRRKYKGDLYFDRIVSITPLGEQDYYDCTVPERHNYISSQGLVNHNSGKDHVCRIAWLRVAYLLLCLKNPHRYFSLPPQDSIHMLNVASSASQANRVFFKPLPRVVERRGSWFADKAETGEDRASATLFSIQFAKNLEAVSGHSDAETQEGLNIILGIADEIDAFKSKEEVEQARGKGLRDPSKSAEALLTMIRSSARTRFPRNFKMAVISYPRFKGSTIQQLTIKGRMDNEQNGESSRVYASGPLATWEVNPRVTGKEQFQEDYDTDPADARGKYECKPELSQNRYFRNDAAIAHAFSRKLSPEPIEVEYRFEGRQWNAKFLISNDLKPISGAEYAMHGDIGISSDRAGVAMAHVVKWQEDKHIGYDDEGGEIEVIEQRPHVKLDFVFSFTSDITTDTPREVQIRWYRELCWELMRRGFNIRRYTFDGFQSTDSMQILETRGIETKRVSTDMSNDVWDTLRDVVYDERLEAYYREITVTELLSLQRLKNGRVDHPPYGSKDEADAVGGAVFGAIYLGGSEGEKPEETWPDAAAPEAFSPCVPDTMDFGTMHDEVFNVGPTDMPLYDSRCDD